MNAHGPDAVSTQAAMSAELAPVKIDDTLAFMFESRWVIRPSDLGMSLPGLQVDYDACWDGFAKARLPQ
jgi:homogentisate 1,2-dioxygenase